MRRDQRGSGVDRALSMLAWILVSLIAMPVTGVYFLLRKDPSRRVLGWVLLVVGLILWILVI